MKKQSNRNYKSNDIVMTPFEFAKEIVDYFKPTGRILEPCCGTGNFIKAFEGCGQNVSTLWCEITKGKDFFDFNEKVDWIITNPPYSIMRKFLEHSMDISDNVCFLITINHIWTKARLRAIKEKGFGIKEILMVQEPENFPKFGFQVGVVHLQKGWKGDIKLNDLKDSQKII